jgi:molecular chaperone HscB
MQKINYFDLFGLEQQYDIDQQIIKDRYLEKQRLYHPDNSHDPETVNKNIEISMMLNKALKILVDDYFRAEHLLNLYGIETSEQALRSVLSNDQISDIYDQFEEVDSIINDHELEIKENALLSYKESIKKSFAEFIRDRNLTPALDLAVRLKYLNSLLENIKSKRNAINRD